MPCIANALHCLFFAYALHWPRLALLQLCLDTTMPCLSQVTIALPTPSLAFAYALSCLTYALHKHFFAYALACLCLALAFLALPCLAFNFVAYACLAYYLLALPYLCLAFPCPCLAFPLSCLSLALPLTYLVLSCLCLA
jgi:hypothetical protein